MTLTGAIAALAAAGALMGSPAPADMASALSLCLNTKLDIPSRAAAFKAQKWAILIEEHNTHEIFTAGTTLATLDALDPSGWSDTRSYASGRSEELVKSSMSGGAFVLRTADNRAAVVLQRNALGLQTCLYAGNDPSLDPVVQILDGSILRKIGPIYRIRGDGPKSSISAHYLGEEGRALIDPPIAYSSTFTLVLDRQPGDTQ